ncbi:M16 family metallopeptidase [Polaribacter cellanae]|uniref:Insulinase family protein n=1 Tax=Polaribacter cellanae TaxID=2818493 RepID=A0A975CNI3_9FLAO|nr:insulinase family protein [Polaribacter cellanae]QTE22848.1 insulinase family protein [Polaribacter cellanae]
MSILKHTVLFCIARMLIFFVFARTFSQHQYSTEKTLRNSFSYYIQQNNYPTQNTLFYLVVKTGSIQENEHQLGYAHFLEHMAFKGGKRFKNKPFTQYLTAQGLQIGVHYNAVTNYDYTLYTIEFPKKENYEMQQKTMAFFADILDGLHLNKQQIATEKKIVLEEKRIANLPSNHYNFKLGNSLYLQRLAIGTDSSINNISQKKLKTFYNQWYQPKNARIFVVGNIDTTATETLIKNTFATIKNNNTTTKKADKQLYKHLTSDVLTDTIQSKSESKVHLEWALAQDFTNLEDQVSKEIANQLFNRILENRLDSLAKNDVKYLSIGLNYFVADVGYSSISYNAKSDIKQGVENVLQEIQRLALHQISEKELQFYVNKALKNIKNRQPKKVSSYQIINTVVDSYLGINFAMPTNQKNELKRVILRKITPEIIKKIAKNRLESNKLRVFIEPSQYPKESLSLREFEQIKAKISEKKLQPIPFDFSEEKKKKKEKHNTVYKLKTPVLKAQKPKQKSYYKNLGITKLHYKNGVKVYLKPIKNHSNEVKVAGVANGGTSIIPDSLYYQYEFAVSYMELGGIANLNPKQLESYNEDKNFGVSFMISEYERNIYGYSKTNQVNEFLKYLYLKMTKATVDTVEFKSVIKDEIKTLEKQKRTIFEPNTYNEKVAELKNVFFPNRKSATTINNFKKLDIFKMQEFYNTAFNNANHWKFIITGNFSIDSITPSLNIYFGNLRKGKNLENNNLFNKNSFKKALKIPLKKDNKIATTTFLFYGRYKPTIKNSVLASLAEKYLRSKITKVLREEHGLVYTPITAIKKNIHPKPFSILEIQYSCKPENSAKAKQIVIQSLEKTIETILTKEELSSYKKGLLLQYNAVLTSSNSYNWNFNILKSLSNNENIGELEYFPDILHKISTKDLQSFIKKTIDFKNMKIIYED